MATELEKQPRRETSRKQEAAGSPENLNEIGASYLPDAGIYENEDSLFVRLDVPGVEKGDVSIDIDETNTLQVRAKTKFREPSDIVFQEFEVGDYYRAFRLSEEFEKDKIEAKLENGILEITVPKKEEVKPKRISINA